MEIEILEEFVNLVETCSFQETAAQMNISQSSLTKHIHKLEEELGLSLFDRSTRSVGLNEFSRTFYPYARQIVDARTEALAALFELANKDRNILNVSYMPIMGQYGLIELLAQDSSQYPDHNLHTIESYQPMSLLKSKKCEFAFVSEEDAQDPNYNQLIFMTDYLAAVFPADHPLAGEKTVTLEQLKGEKFILHSSSTGVPHEETRKFLQLCEENHFEPDIVAETEFTNSVLRFVKSKRGIAVLNRQHIPRDVSDISIVNFAPSVHSYIYLLYRRKLSSPYAKDFLHFIIETVNT